jgi:hypothetical protein
MVDVEQRGETMHWYISEGLQRARERDLREQAGRTALARTDGSSRRDDGAVVIRRSAAGDGPALIALAALDGREWRSGPALLAEVDGSLRAALPLDGTAAFSDPFHSTAELLALLELRAVQLGELCRGRLRTVLSRLSFAHAQ